MVCLTYSDLPEIKFCTKIYNYLPVHGQKKGTYIHEIICRLSLWSLLHTISLTFENNCNLLCTINTNMKSSSYSTWVKKTQEEYRLFTL